MKNRDYEPKGLVLSVANSKGGVGKTTVSVNLAYELAFQGHKVAMIDLDGQCDLTKVYLPEGHKGPTILDVLQKKSKVADALVSVEEQLFLMPGSREISRFNFTGSEQAIVKVVKLLRQKDFDFVIVDHPPSLHEAALAGFIASNFVLLVCEAEAFSIENLDHLISDIEGIAAAFKSNLKVVGILMNKIDRRRCLTKRTLKYCQDAFGDALLQTTISVDTAIPNSLDQKIPVRNLHWRSRTVSQFSCLTKEMLGRMKVNNGT